MKKFLFLTLILCALSGVFISRQAQGAQPRESPINGDSPVLAAKHAVLINQKTGEVLFEKKGDEKCYPASTTKILTALTALDYADPDEMITVGDAVNFAALDSSKAGIRFGERLSLEQLLNAMLIPSGNDAAYAIAAYIGRKSVSGKIISEREAVDRFCTLMNIKARDLGATGSNFTDPDGYDGDSHYTTARDIARFAAELIKNKLLSDIVARPGYTLPAPFPDKTGDEDGLMKRQLANTNRLILKGDPFYDPDCTGVKTGHTDQAGYCLVASGEKNGEKVIAVVMGSTENDVWDDARKLLDYGLNRK